MVLSGKGGVSFDAVVVRLANQGESNRVLEVVSAEQGRVGLLARGGRASRKRFGGALDRFVSLRVQAQPSSGLWTLVAADILDLRLGIRSSLEAIERASRLSECVRVLVPEHHRSPELCAVLAAGLDRLAAGDVVGAAAAYPRLLEAAGICPDLPTCGRCGRSDAPLGSLWGAAGQPLCIRCAPAHRVLGDAFLRAMAGAEIIAVHVADAIEDEIMHVVESHAGVRLHSRAGLGTQRWGG